MVNVYDKYSCSLFGHNVIKDEIALKQSLHMAIENLVTRHDVYHYLFGTRSTFYNICHEVLLELKKKYPQIKMTIFLCEKENAYYLDEVDAQKGLLNNLFRKEMKVLGFDHIIKVEKTKYARKASYIVRNQAMVDATQFCLFYYREGLSTKLSTDSNHMTLRQKESGTKIILEYAKQKGKEIIAI